MQHDGTLAIVPARGGSKRVPGKNLRTVHGRSLVARAIEVGRAVAAIDAIWVSTDDERIAAEADVHGAAVRRRPAHLATDIASTRDVVLDLVSHVPCDRFVVLQPTSPLRSAGDIRRCLAALDAGATSVTTVFRYPHPVEWFCRRSRDDHLQPVLGWDALHVRSQDREPVWAINGAVYAATTAYLRAGGALVGPETVAVPMPRSRSVDIDTEDDLVSAQAAPRMPTDDERELIVFGGGGHALAVGSVLRGLGLVPSAVVAPEARDGIAARTLVSDSEGIEEVISSNGVAVVAVGDNERRVALVERLLEAGCELPAIVSRSATVSSTATLGPGAIVMEHAHVGPATRLGAATLVNTGAVIEHDVVLGAGTHVAPGTVVTGSCRTERVVLVGVGATILPSVTIGAGSIVGAGAVVVGPVPSGVTVIGVPAGPVAG